MEIRMPLPTQRNVVKQLAMRQIVAANPTLSGKVVLHLALRAVGR